MRTREEVTDADVRVPHRSNSGNQRTHRSRSVLFLPYYLSRPTCLLSDDRTGLLSVRGGGAMSGGMGAVSVGISEWVAILIVLVALIGIGKLVMMFLK
jgi:hypothetical protein